MLSRGEDGTPSLEEGIWLLILPASQLLSKRLVQMPQLSRRTLQLAIPFYWLIWALGQEKLGLNQYSSYYVIAGK